MINRRSLFKTFAGTTFAASAMRFFMRTAESATFPTRFLFLFTQHGRDRESMCTGTGTGFQLGPGVAALEPFKKKITILDGLKIPPHVNEEHPNGRCAMLTGRPSAAAWAATGISIDRYLANKLTAGKSVYTGIETPKPGRQELDQPISWEGANASNGSFINGSSALMSRLFSGMAAAPTPSNPMPAAPAPTSGSPDELALYDHLMAEVSRLQKVAPAAQAEKLQLHVQSLQQIRAGFAGSGGGGGTPDPAPVLRACGTPKLDGATDDVDRIGLLLAHALACGQSRIAVFSMGAYQPHHEQSHWDNASVHAELKATDKKFTQKVLNVLRYLDSFPEGNGTLLDNTIVVWSSEVSGPYGKGEDVHDTVQMPFVLAGGLGGKFKMGQRIVADGRTNVDLYRTIATQMGVADPSDWGDPKFTTGLLKDVLV